MFQNTATLEPLTLVLDLEKFEELETFVQNVYDACGHIDILINNGGISHRGSILNTKMDVFKSIMAVNYFGSVALTKGKQLKIFYVIQVKQLKNSLIHIFQE